MTQTRFNKWYHYQSNEALKLELTLSVEDKVRQGNERITARIELLESEHKRQSALVQQLIKNDESSISSSVAKVLIDKWMDLVPDEQVNGWQDENYIALAEAIKKNHNVFILSKLTRKMELGIKHVTQRMKSIDLYPPQPVRDAEREFFRRKIEVKLSTRVGDNNLCYSQQQEFQEEQHFIIMGRYSSTQLTVRNKQRTLWQYFMNKHTYVRDRLKLMNSFQATLMNTYGM